MESRFGNSIDPNKNSSEGDSSDKPYPRPRRLMKYRKTNITQMLDPETLSPQKTGNRPFFSMKVGDSPQASIFPELKISKFTSSYKPEDGLKATPRNRDLGNSDSSSPKPVRKQSVNLTSADLYPIFKKKFSLLSQEEQRKVVSLLKDIMMTSPTHKVLELDHPMVAQKFSAVK